MTKKVPFIDLRAGTKEIRREIDEAIGGVIDATSFVLGPDVDRFEEEFARYCGTAHCVGVSSGTAAIHLALRAFGVGPGDEVITVPNSFIATAEAILMAGAKPVFVDVEEASALIDIAKLRKAVTPKTKAVIPVHLYGQICDMDPIMELASKHRFVVIEDACQAHGASYNGRRAGSIGHAGAFSFYPSKNLGAFGEGGAFTTNDENAAKRVKALRHHAQFSRNMHQELGFNDRLDSIQAAVLRVKLRHLDEWNEKRRRVAERYRSSLAGTPYRLQAILPGCTHIYHLFAIGSDRKPQVTKALTEAGIGWGEHYPIPIHLQPAFDQLKLTAGSFPVAEKLMRETVSLPMFPELPLEDVDYVSDVLRRAIS